ncbi:MAG: carboxypeptidase-like regulatory domain-containing protein [Acidobacteriaceae bacterium]
MRSPQPLVRRILRWRQFLTVFLSPLILFTALLLFSPNAAAGQDVPGNQPTSIHGTVINSVTRDPISRALVHSADNRYAMFTDNEGNFDFTLPASQVEQTESGSVLLLARKPGFLDVPQNGIDPRSVSDRQITIALIPEALIRGRVTTSGGDPAVGINVQLFSRQVQDGLPRWGAGATTQTNSNGEFRFAELSAGAYRLVTNELLDTDPATVMPRIQPYGFPPVCYPGMDDFSAATTIQLAAGETFQADVALTRKPYYSVRIPVAGEFVNGINVTVSVQGHRSPGYSLGYNQEEHRLEGLLPNGNYQVEGDSFGPGVASGIVNIAVAGRPVEGPAMVITNSAPIKVNVSEQFSSPDTVAGAGRWSDGKHTFTYSGARLYLQISSVLVDDFGPPRNASIRPPTKQEDNELVLEGLAPGRYWLRFNSSRGYVASATMGSVDLLHQPVVIGQGSSSPIEVTMKDDDAELEGSLAAFSGTGKKGARDVSSSNPPVVYCVPLSDGPGQFQQIWISDRKFDLQKVAPGNYLVLAFSSPQADLPYRDAEAMKAYESQGQIVHLQPGERKTIQLSVISPKS